MSSEDLVRKLETSDYLLPAEIQKQISDEQLLKDLEEIFNKYPHKLKTEESFRSKYIDIFIYLLRENLTKKTKLKFDEKIIDTLLSYPEAA